MRGVWGLPGVGRSRLRDWSKSYVSSGLRQCKRRQNRGAQNIFRGVKYRLGSGGFSGFPSLLFSLHELSPLLHTSS